MPEPERSDEHIAEAISLIEEARAMAPLSDRVQLRLDEAIRLAGTPGHRGKAADAIHRALHPGKESGRSRRLPERVDDRLRWAMEILTVVGDAETAVPAR